MQYSFPDTPCDPWGEQYLRYAIRDFAGGEPCIVFTNWDASRLDWLAAWSSREMNIQKWGYFPVDSEGPAGGQPQHIARTIAGFDRTLAASKWGMDVAQTQDWIPHGIWVDRFCPQENAREMLGWDADDVWTGVVMTNQSRKDWPAAFECAAHLKARYGDRFKFWAHIDVPVRYWDIDRLAADYGVEVDLTHDLTDAQLAARYSACDCTILPSAGEGFGFPIVESMACGTPCVTTRYGGGAELVPSRRLVQPVAMRVDTVHNVMRAVLNGKEFADLCVSCIAWKQSQPQECREQMVAQVEHLSWQNLRHVWVKWFLKGVKT